MYYVTPILYKSVDWYFENLERKTKLSFKVFKTQCYAMNLFFGLDLFRKWFET